MKSKMIAAALAAVVTMGFTLKTEAAPWGRGYGHGHWFRPHVEARFYAPRVIIPAPVVIGGAYAYPAPPPPPPCNTYPQYNNGYYNNGYGYYNQPCR